MAANSSYEVELQALRGELGELRGILAIPEVRDALKSVRKGKKKEEVVAGQCFPLLVKRIKVKTKSKRRLQEGRPNA